MTSHNLHTTLAELREVERRRDARQYVPVPPPKTGKPPGSFVAELAPVVSLVAGFAALLAVAAPSL